MSAENVMSREFVAGIMGAYDAAIEKARAALDAEAVNLFYSMFTTVDRMPRICTHENLVAEPSDVAGVYSYSGGKYKVWRIDTPGISRDVGITDKEFSDAVRDALQCAVAAYFDEVRKLPDSSGYVATTPEVWLKREAYVVSVFVLGFAGVEMAECHDGTPCNESKCEAASICVAPTPDRPETAAERMRTLEGEHGGKLMHVQDLPPRYDEVKAWMDGRYGSRNVLAVLCEPEDVLKLKWYTRDSLISVTVRLPSPEHERGYIGAVRECRSPRPGETWVRGNDMADGPYAHETWLRVIADAAFCDLLPLAVIDDIDVTTRGLKSQREALKPWGLDADGDKRVGVDPADGGRKEAFKPWGLDVDGDVGESADDATYKMLRQALGRHVVSVYANERAARSIEATSCDMDLAGAKVDDRTMAYQSTVTIGGKVYDVQLVSSALFAKSLAECRHDMSIAYAAMDEAVKAYLDEVQVLVARSPGGMFTPATFRAVRSGERVDLHVYGFVFVPMIPKGVDPAAPGADHSAVWIASAPQPKSEE